MRFWIFFFLLTLAACQGVPVPPSPPPDSGLAERPSNTTCLAAPDEIPAINLADTGCVQAEDPTQPAEGLIPFTLNLPLWSDGAIKDRWMALPDDTQVSIDAQGDWFFPVGTVLVKNFSVDGQLIETRLLMYQQLGIWAGFTYEWNESVTQATLVPPGGKLRNLANGQVWLYPGRNQCLQCHTAVAGRTLGPQTPQMNRLFTYPSTGITANQITTLLRIGVLGEDPGDPDSLPKFFQLEDSLPPPEEMEATARAYLHTNCSHCHQPGGPGGGGEDFRYYVPLPEMNACGVPPSLDDFGISGALLLAPGEPDISVLLYRMLTLDFGRMPPLATSVVDTLGTQIISDWIASLSDCS